MLVLSRKAGEVITVGPDIRITIVEFRGDKVRVGIDAPKGVPVHRLEVYEAIQREKAAAPADLPVPLPPAPPATPADDDTDDWTDPDMPRW